MKHCRWAPRWRFVPATTGSSLTIAIARFALALGVTPYDMMLQAVGAAADPASGGRQMPTHWSSRALHIVSTSSSTATQLLHAVGCAEAGRTFSRHPEAAAKAEGDYRAFHDVEFHGDEVVLACVGEGSTSQGEFWEALNTASNQKLPVIFCVEDNGYAISVPVEVNTPGGNISRLVANFPNFHFAEIDGNDPVVCLRAFQAGGGALPRGPRAGVGSRPLRAAVFPFALRRRQELPLAPPSARPTLLRDPIARMRTRLIGEGILTVAEIDELERRLEREAAEAAERALEAPLPAVEDITDTRLLRRSRSHERRFCHGACRCTAAPANGAAAEAGQKGAGPRTMADLINVCLRDEMRRDPRIVIYGEDVADASRDEALAEVKGKGGVFKLTAGLQTEFGSERVFNSPLAEANIVGRAVGYALRGMKPVVEIQFFDYIWPAMHQIRNELSVMRWRSNGAWAAPVVIRVPIGGYLTGGAIYHSQSGESIFTHTPGLRVVFPRTRSTPTACCARPFAATIRCCSSSTSGSIAKPMAARRILGRILRFHSGKRRSFVPAPTSRWSPMARWCRARCRPRNRRSASTASKPRFSICARSILTTGKPLPTSVRKTNRVIVAHEDMLSWGYGAEIAARIADELFDDLDAPVRRIGAMDTFVAYQPKLEDAILPQPETILKAIVSLKAY